MGYARILARAVLNPGLPNYSFDDINTMSYQNGKQHLDRATYGDS